MASVLLTANQQTQSLSAVLKCPATQCTQQQHSNEEERSVQMMQTNIWA